MEYATYITTNFTRIFLYIYILGFIVCGYDEAHTVVVLSYYLGHRVTR